MKQPAHEHGTSAPQRPEGWRRGSLLHITLGLAWLALVGLGMGVMINYETQPGHNALAPGQWPVDSPLTHQQGKPHLLMFVHPKCPCTRASIGELALIMSQCQGRVDAHVVILKPSVLGEAWSQSDLYRSAAAIPGVTVVLDKDGAETQRFGVVTSGDALLYRGNGTLAFSGGVTASRGHSGSNDGRDAIVSILLDDRLKGPGDGKQVAKSCVYGCSLFDEPPCPTP